MLIAILTIIYLKISFQNKMFSFLKRLTWNEKEKGKGFIFKEEHVLLARTRSNRLSWSDCARWRLREFIAPTEPAQTHVSSLQGGALTEEAPGRTERCSRAAREHVSARGSRTSRVLLSLTSSANPRRDLRVYLLLWRVGQNTKSHLNYTSIGLL